MVTDGSNIMYTYFLLTDTEMYADHVLDTSYSKNAKKCTSTLFKGLGQRLSIEANMEYEGVVVADVSSFYAKMTEYITKSQWTFSLALPVAEGNKINATDYEKAVKDGIQANGFVGAYQYGHSSMQVGNYVVYNFTIEKAN